MEYNGKKPILVYQKHADEATNRIIIPKIIIENYSRYFTMEVYEDGIMVLKPIMKKEE